MLKRTAYHSLHFSGALFAILLLSSCADIEQEKNGVYYYDRRPKFDAAKWKAIFEKIPSIIEE